MTHTETALRLSVVLTEREIEMYRALQDCSDGLAAELHERYAYRGQYAFEQRRFDRGMIPVRRARELISRIESEAIQPANDRAPLVGGA